MPWRYTGSKLRIRVGGHDMLGLCLSFGDPGAMKGKIDRLVVCWCLDLFVGVQDPSVMSINFFVCVSS